MVPFFSKTPTTLAKMALVVLPQTMKQANPRDEAFASQAMNPLLPIIQCLLRRDLEPTILPPFPATLLNNPFTLRGTLPIPLHIQPLLRRSLEPGTSTSLPAIPFCDKATDEDDRVSNMLPKMFPQNAH